MYFIFGVGWLLRRFNEVQIAQFWFLPAWIIENVQNLAIFKEFLIEMSCWIRLNSLKKIILLKIIELNSKWQGVYCSRLDSFEKSFDFGWNRTRVTTIASRQRWPLGHPAQNIQKNLKIFILNCVIILRTTWR